MPIAGRCDRCGAAGKVEVHFAAGALMFCRHHYKKHLPSLLFQAKRIYDPEEEQTMRQDLLPF